MGCEDMFDPIRPCDNHISVCHIPEWRFAEKLLDGNLKKKVQFSSSDHDTYCRFIYLCYYLIINIIIIIIFIYLFISIKFTTSTSTWFCRYAGGRQSKSGEHKRALRHEPLSTSELCSSKSPEFIRYNGELVFTIS